MKLLFSDVIHEARACRISLSLVVDPICLCSSTYRSPKTTPGRAASGSVISTCRTLPKGNQSFRSISFFCSFYFEAYP